MSSKKIVVISIVAVLLIGGSVAAYVLLDLSAKQQYFLAEKKSVEFVADKAEARYQPEITWYEQSEENPTETELEFSGEYNDPNAMNGFGGMGPAQFINNATLTITTAIDKSKKHMASDIKANMGALEVGDINFYLTENQVMLGLPFLEELVQLNGEDLGKLLKEVDPNTFTGDEKLDFNAFFEGSTGVLSKEDQKYIQEEYLEMVYDKLPDEAFELTDETVNVDSNAIDSQKITMHLSEKQTKDLLLTVLEKMENDERLKEIISEQIGVQQFGAGITSSSMTPDVQNQIDQFIGDFETELKDAQEKLKEFKIPDGVQSTIWVKDELIVKRDFSVKLGPTNEQLSTLSVNGTQLLKDENQTFNYNFEADNQNGNYNMMLTGDLKTTPNEVSDSIKLSFEETELSYEGMGTLEDGNRKFERKFSFSDAEESGSLIWSGNASYNNDQMTSEHNFSVEAPDIGQDLIGLHIEKNAKLINTVELDSDKEVKNIGNMSKDELNQYFEMEVTPQFQQWIFGLMGTGGNLNGF
ncbi:flagellar basal body-associated FliL family protein [Virgibacillus litoralis]|uniref:DUF945 domain-containing protein n=1 Tax=Virgibacillus litoralis TaxID=578221 RepID=A0ABS4HA33_9BACI|nr:DUF6583 family protein [Virgibacillus litoralis]MBP1947733.1 hypothetical protein [Virgibacillus litoralis]